MGFFTRVLGSLAKLPGKTWATLAAVLAASGLAWAGYHTIDGRGYSRCEREHAVALAAHIERAAMEARKIALQDAEIGLAGTAERERIRVVYRDRDREKEIEKHVPISCSQCRMSPAGVGMLNDALSNAKPEAQRPGGQPPTGPGPGRSGDGREPPGNGSLIDLRQWKVL